MSGKNYLFDDDDNRVEGLTKQETEYLISESLPEASKTQGANITITPNSNYQHAAVVQLNKGKYFLYASVRLGGSGAITCKFSNNTEFTQTVQAGESNAFSAMLSVEEDFSYHYLDIKGSGTIESVDFYAVQIGGVSIDLDDMSF